MKCYNSIFYQNTGYLTLITKFQKYPAILLLLIPLLIGSNTSFGLEEGNQGATMVSIHEVAMQIRRYKSWQILDASPRKKDTGRYYFRFKLLRNDGTVKIINIDPRNPNLRRLE